MANGTFRDPKTKTLFPSREFFLKQKARQTAGLSSTFGVGTQTAQRPDLAAISRGVQQVAGQIPALAQGVSQVTGQPAAIAPQFQQQFPQLAQQIGQQQLGGQQQAQTRTIFTSAPLAGAGATDDLRTQLTDLQKRITTSLQPSEEELTAEKQLRDLIASRELGLAQAAEQPIATPFITGQQAAITRRASIQALPLQAQLGQLQQRRQAALDIGKAELGFAESELERRERAEGDTSIVESNGRQLLISNRTGEVIKDLGEVAAEEKQTAITEAGGRRLLIDKQTGEQIADLGTAGTSQPSVKTTFKETDRGLEIFRTDQQGNIIGREVVGLSGTNARKVREIRSLSSSLGKN